MYINYKLHKLYYGFTSENSKVIINFMSSFIINSVYRVILRIFLQPFPLPSVVVLCI